MRISVSQLKLFKACRRAYFFRYKEGLIPKQDSEALETGKGYHALIEEYYTQGTMPEGLSKEDAMATAYIKYIAPKFHVNSVECWVSYQLNEADSLFGRLDGIADDGHLVEHKTTSQDIGEQYEYNLQWDEQILAYMLCTNCRKIWYTVCRKPTIRLKKGESEEEFFQRMVDWYAEDTENKIRVLEVTRTDEEVEAFKEQVAGLIPKIDGCDMFYPNCGWCNVWGRRCEYSSICLNYDPKQEYAEFERRDRNGDRN